ncbi:MAG: hypothetical protein EA390_00970 [Balneolaceae bacterium]|nr:MAG: hypothetical protein EA390_00970 [Balneolaceae bacterium]
MIVTDENIDQFLINHLDTMAYEVFSIRKHCPGISDREVIKLVKTKKALLITEDKDFGELVFAHNIKDCSVILLRYEKSDFEQIKKNLVKALQIYYKDPHHYFITITKDKTRVRNL